MKDINEGEQSVGWWKTPLGHGLGQENVGFIPEHAPPGTGPSTEWGRLSSWVS